MTDEELKALRTGLGLTQDELGKRLGVARVTVARWEIGLRRVPELAARLVQHVAKEVRAEQKRKKRTQAKGGCPRWWNTPDSLATSSKAGTERR